MYGIYREETIGDEGGIYKGGTVKGAALFCCLLKIYKIFILFIENSHKFAIMTNLRHTFVALGMLE